MIHISECVFFYRATIRNEPFQVGKKIFWDLSKYYYEDATDYDMDPSKVIGRHNLFDDQKKKDEKENSKDIEKKSLGKQENVYIVKKNYE